MSNITVYRPDEVTPIDGITEPGLPTLIKDKVRSLFEPTPQQVLEKLELHKKCLQHQIEIVELRERLKVAETTGHLKALVAVDEARRSMASESELRRAEEKRQSDHKVYLTQNATRIATMENEVAEYVLKGAAERISNYAKLPNNKLNNEHAYEVAAVAYQVLAAEENMSRDPSNTVYISLYQARFAELSALCSAIGKEPEEVMKRIRPTE